LPYVPVSNAQRELINFQPSDEAKTFKFLNR